jgi:hypothetical protein
MSSSPKFSELADQYLVAVRDYLLSSSESPMQKEAQALTQRAMRSGLGVLDLASMHQIALVVLMSHAKTTQEQARVAKAASVFFFQTLAPFEQEHQVLAVRS